MKKDLEFKLFPVQIKKQQDKRSEIIHFKTTPRESLDILLTAKKCGMTVSSYVRSRALGYQPVARLTTEEKDLITKLSQCRSDAANLINAINGLSTDEKLKLFHTYPLMFEWYCEVKPITDAVSEFIREVRNLKMLRPRTTNKDRKEASL